MAITINAPMDNGKIVEVQEYLGDHDFQGPVWRVSSIGSPFHWEPGVMKQTVAWPDRLLMPIRGDLEPCATKRLTEPEFDAACDRWIQGVEA